MNKFLFGPISKMNGGGASGRVANRNLITAEQIELRQQLENVNAPANNFIDPPEPPSSPPATGSNSDSGVNTNAMPAGDGTYQMSTDPSAGIPILYGQCQVRGAVFDSELTGNGTILTTAIMLSERTGAGINGNANYTLNEVFFNDAKLNLNANGTVANAILNNGNVSTKYNNNTKVMLYQGDVDTPIDKIQPGVDADYPFARYFMLNWANVQVQARGTLFALVEQTYDAENGVQGLGTWTFDITNDTASNPGDVMFDYLTNERFGAQYPATTINSDTLVGTGVDSLKSIANETRLFTSSIADDDANISDANIANGTLYPQLVTNGSVGDLINYATSSKHGATMANLRTSGNNTITTSKESNVISPGVNRFKIFWANAATQGANCTNIMSGNASTSPNTFTAFIDIARFIPDGSNIAGFTFTQDANVTNGTMFPGDTYVFTTATGGGGAGSPAWSGGAIETITIGAGITPTATITNLLVEGDKIRPEGSPFVYTVASNVSVTGAGYKQFSIPVKERIVVPDFANIDMGNATLGTAYNNYQNDGAQVQAKRFAFDSDDIGILWNNSWPFANANVDTAVNFPTTANMTQHANLLFSNALVGNAIMQTPNTTGGNTSLSDSIVLGEEKNMTINGLIKSDKTVQDVQKQILKHSGAMLNWELPEGRWKAIPNANANISGAKTFNDDNIVGEIKVTTSDITTYYNSARAQYVEKNHNSVKEDIIVYTPNFELNTNESKHKMELNYGLCDSGSEAQRKADVELKQNRLDKVINFKSDYTGLGVEPGDIIKVTNTDYGFADKTFRAVRVRETMDDDILMLNITAIEWSNETYTDRIPFRKPALDDIEFEPEEYQDVIDAGCLKPGSVPFQSIGRFMGNVTLPNGGSGATIGPVKFPLAETDVGQWTLMAEGHFDYAYTGTVVTSGTLLTILTYNVNVNYEDGTTTSFSANHRDGNFTTIPIHQHMSMTYLVASGASNVEITAIGELSTTQSHDATTLTFDTGFISVPTRANI